MISPSREFEDFRPQSLSILAPFIDRYRTRTVRNILDWAEDEICLADDGGPFAGLPFRRHRQPWLNHFLREYDNPRWYEYALTAPTQSGKSFGGFDLPVMHTLFERQQNQIIAAPIMEVLKDKTAKKLLDVIRDSPYGHLLPRTGGGSRGGAPDRIDFQNGRCLKLMSFEGGDKSKSSFTCPNVCMTEIDGLREMSASVEANAIEQVKGRAMSRERKDRKVVLECTITVEAGPINQYVNTIGSGGRLFKKCPHCSAWVQPERPHLKGWQDAKNEMEAEVKAAWHCPACDAPWTELERREAVANSLLIHKGQSVENDKVVGDLPMTRTMGLRVAAVDNLFLSAADVGMDCWHAENTAEDRESAEKKLCQFVFVDPYEPPGLDVVRIDHRKVEQRQTVTTKGVAPNSTRWITLGLDVGKFDCWMVANAWLLPERRGVVIEHERLRLRMNHNGKWGNADDFGFELVFTHCMNEWLEGWNKGWPIDQKAGEVLDYSAAWMDCRWQGEEHDQKVVYDWIKSLGDKRWMPIMGHTKVNYQNKRYTEPRLGAKNVVSIGNRYHIKYVPEIDMLRGHIDVDDWRTITQRRFLKNKDEPGSIVLYSSKNPREHAQFVNHLDAVVNRKEFKPGKGEDSKLIAKSEADHMGDSEVYACVAGHYVGFRVSEKNEPKTRKPPAKRAPVRRPGNRPFVVR